jgi:hypothetical protein
MEPTREDLKAHAMQLQQALNTGVQSELIARRDLDEYRKAEIAELRNMLSRYEEKAGEQIARDAGIEPDAEEGDG